MMRIRGLLLTFSMRCYAVLAVLVTLSIHSPVTVRGELANNTKLRIAVPPKSGFTQFVKITRDASSGQPVFGGFAIEVFNESVKATLDSKLISFDLVSFQREDGTMNGSYDDMVEAVYNKEYDGAVGDITIRYTRTRWVDFTIAYTSTGTSMLIPTRQQKNNNVVNSLHSLTQEMVIGTFVLFFLSILVFVGSDVLHFLFGRTKDNRLNAVRPSRLGHGADQNAVFGKDAWKREMLGIVKGTRLMMLLWFVIMLYLITYYGTNMISLLARAQSIAPNKSLDQIIRMGENVGYNRGSYIFDELKEAGIPDTKLFPYDSEDGLLDLFSKGTNEGGIDVAIDDTHTLSVFFAQHCNNYTLLPFPSLHASGYGFAFPIGSKYVQEVSNGIIKLIDNGELGKIQDRTIGGVGTCDVDPTTDIVSDIATPNVIRTFKACAIASVALLVVTYAVYIIT